MTELSGVDIGILLLRVIAGLTMAAHGYQKFFSGGKIAGTGKWFDSIGMRPGKLHALAAASFELGSGILLALGLLTPLAGAAFVGLMLVAAYTVHRKAGFFSVNSGWEYNLVLATIGVAVATIGPGTVSVDHLLGLDATLSGLPGLLIAGVGGFLVGVAQLAIFYRPGKTTEES
jgi:putative oxidoreductase